MKIINEGMYMDKYNDYYYLFFISEIFLLKQINIILCTIKMGQKMYFTFIKDRASLE